MVCLEILTAVEKNDLFLVNFFAIGDKEGRVGKF